MEVRKAGNPSFKGAPRKMTTPYSAFEQGTPGECRINQNQMAAIQHLYHTSPSLQAARAILVGQLLSSGLSLTRAGESVKLTPTFSKHLEARWMPFARAVVDEVLMYGFCVVSVEEDDPEPFAAFVAAQRRAAAGRAAARCAARPGRSFRTARTPSCDASIVFSESWLPAVQSTSVVNKATSPFVSGGHHLSS